MVFLNENPQVRNVIFPDGWSSADLDNIPKFQEAMSLFHVQINFVANYYGEKAKKASHLGCCNKKTRKKTIDYNEILLLQVLCAPTTTWYYMYTKHFFHIFLNI